MAHKIDDCPPIRITKQVVASLRKPLKTTSIDAAKPRKLVCCFWGEHQAPICMLNCLDWLMAQMAGTHPIVLLTQLANFHLPFSSSVP